MSSKKKYAKKVDVYIGILHSYRNDKTIYLVSNNLMWTNRQIGVLFLFLFLIILKRALKYAFSSKKCGNCIRTPRVNIIWQAQYYTYGY